MGKLFIHTPVFIISVFLLVNSLYVMPSMAENSEEDGSYVSTVYNDRNGLPTGEANTILQTSDGYIWIGSYGGLIRYDGSEFRNFSLENQVNSSSIRSLFEDREGRLWIGTNDKGVICMQEDEFISIQGPEDFSFLCIRDFAQSDDGTIYIASNSGMAYISGNTLVPIEDTAVNGKVVYTIGTDSYDRIWAVLDSGRFAVLKGCSVEKVFESNEIFETEDVYSINCYDQYVYLGSSENIMARITLTDDSLDIDDLLVDYFETGSITTHNRIDVTSQGDVLISGMTGAYAMFADGTNVEFGHKPGASSVNCTILDYEENIWMASSSTGVIKYSESYYLTPNEAAGLEGRAINTITENNGLYVIGSDEGVQLYDENWEMINNSLSETLDGIRVRCSIADRQNNIWLATYSGVFCYNPETEEIINITQQEGLLNNRTRVVYELSDGSIAVGTQSGVSIIKNLSVTENYGVEEGLVNSSILCIYEDNNGILYLGSDGDGIYTIQDGVINNYGFDEGLSEGVILRMLPDAAGNGFFISAGSSLYYWKDHIFTKLENWEKSAGSIFDMYDRDGRLWILQNNGIISIDKEMLLSGEEADTVIYSFSHGLTGSLNANTWNYLKDNSLYLATRNGISIFSFKEIVNPEPLAVINNITVDGIVYEHPDTIDLPNDVNRITFNFAELSFSGTSTLMMEYQLKNFDESPILYEDGKSGGISYTNLPGGEYTFMLRIYDANHPDIARNYEITIHKDKKITEYSIFWIVIVTLGIIALSTFIYLFYRRKITNLKMHQEEYRQIIEQSLQTFAKTIDAKDKYTNGHSVRVARYSREIAKRLGFSEKEQERIYYLAMLHDIGKIGIPDHILTKPGKLTDEERAVIQKHPAIGGEILCDFTALEGITEGAKYHHERFDGTGYCEGLKGMEIPLVARIVGVADTYDAMSSDRCYRRALSKDVIIKELANGAGTQFDPEIVTIMLQMVEEGAAPIPET